MAEIKAQSAEADSAEQTKICQINMQTIANEMQAYKVRTRAATYPAIADISKEIGPGKILEDLDKAPECPESPNNIYSVQPTSDGGFRVICTDPKHGKWDDGQLYPSR